MNNLRSVLAFLTMAGCGISQDAAQQTAQPGIASPVSAATASTTPPSHRFALNTALLQEIMAGTSPGFAAVQDGVWEQRSDRRLVRIGVGEPGRRAALKRAHEQRDELRQQFIQGGDGDAGLKEVLGYAEQRLTALSALSTEAPLSERGLVADVSRSGHIYCDGDFSVGAEVQTNHVQGSATAWTHYYGFGPPYPSDRYMEAYVWASGGTTQFSHLHYDPWKDIRVAHASACTPTRSGCLVRAFAYIHACSFVVVEVEENCPTGVEFSPVPQCGSLGPEGT